MNTVRFGWCVGIAWGSVSLLLVAVSLVNGDGTAWVELDFKPLTGSIMLAASAFGGEPAFGGFVLIAEAGLPIAPLPVAGCALLSFADGFASGFLIALLYNRISIPFKKLRFHPSVSFAAATGIAFGISSGLLALTVRAYRIDLTSFEFAVRPLWIVFSALSGSVDAESFERLRQSYVEFPSSFPGALIWAGWAFVDGFTAGLALSYLFLKARNRLGRRQSPADRTRPGPPSGIAPG